MFTLYVLALLALAGGLLFTGRGYLAWVVPGALYLGAWALGGLTVGFWIAAVVFAGLAVLFGFPPVRRAVVTAPVYKFMAGFLPKLGETERIALEAGTTWWDAELFSGRPDWRHLFGLKTKQISEREQAFLDNETEELCRMLDEHKNKQRQDIPEDVWNFIKEKRFWSMIIPEKYGGLEFSAAANSAVVMKIGSRSPATAVTVMVPNSLGPGELLHQYGTDAQKEHYLPRLATGEEIPCFALTEPEAGSDAGSLKSRGVVCKGEWNGEEVLGIRLNWQKRYTTLSPVATVLGLAFNLSDPDHLLGDKEDIGITVALVPTDLPGITIGERHDPLGAPFLNGPHEGKDVFIPIDQIIGGQERAGDGWRMLMDCLSAGRGISLPSLAVGSAKVCTRLVGAYATVREQFGLPVGKFEGVEEYLTKIAGSTYYMDATRIMTNGAIDAGEKPSVVSAVVKCYLTESMRDVVNCAMDVLAGASISRGPRNLLSHAYDMAPIGITVEGSNVLARSMIIFGQGAIRCHPFAMKEMLAVADNDATAFDRAFWGHINFVFTNVARSFVGAITGARVFRTETPGLVGHYEAHVSRMSAAFALLSDAAMGTIGGDLKRKEKISGRLADCLAWLYMASATMKRFHDDGQPDHDEAHFRWSMDLCLHSIQEAMLGILRNLPNRPAAMALYPVVFPLGANFALPDDRTGAAVGQSILGDGSARERLSDGLYIPGEGDPGLGAIEHALEAMNAAEEPRKRYYAAIKKGDIAGATPEERRKAAIDAGILNETEAEMVAEADRLQWEAIQVDAFTSEELMCVGAEKG